MNDFSKYKSGDNIILQVKIIIEENNNKLNFLSSSDFEKEVIEKFKILQVVNRDNDFILIFERSDVFKKHLLSSAQYAAVLIDSFILDTRELDEFNYIKVLDQDAEDKQKLDKINKLKQVIAEKLKNIYLYQTEYLDLNKQIDALNEFPNSPAFKFILNKMNEINLSINKNKELINKSNKELEKYLN